MATAAAAAEWAAVPDEKILVFPRGLFGFRGPLRFTVLMPAGTPEIFSLLQSLDDPNLGFTLADPRAFYADYAPHCTPEDMEELGLESPDQALWRVLVTVPADFRKATLNLRAPVLINPLRRLAKQIILAENYPVRQPLVNA